MGYFQCNRRVGVGKGMKEMKMRAFALITAPVALVLASCSSVQPALSCDPKTGQSAQCAPNTASGNFPVINAWTAQHGGGF
jgi:hypothetical protein